MTAAAIALSRRGPGAERDAAGQTRLRATRFSIPHTHHRVGMIVVAYAAAPLRALQTQVLFGSVVFAAALTVLAGALFVIGRAIRRVLEPVTTMTAEAEDGSDDLELAIRPRTGPGRTHRPRRGARWAVVADRGLAPS